MPPREVRRKPLALALLWCNYAAQQDGLETWWCVDDGQLDAASVAAGLAEARAAADELAGMWAEVE
jgi:hypothetical protein